MVQVEPAPSAEALDAYYRADYRKHKLYGSDVADTSRFPFDNLFYYNRGRSIAELVAPHLSTAAPRILDIGAGYGHILHAFGERYPEAERQAIEYSDVCVRHLEGIGVAVENRAVEEVLPALEGRFDVVVLSHVLEHVREPRAVLELVRRSLAPGGVFYVEVPNIPRESLLRYPDNPWAPRWDEPHITFYSLETLRRLMGAAGFGELFCDTGGPHYRYIPGWRFRMPPAKATLLNLLPRPVFHFLRRQTLTAGMRVQTREPSFYEYGGFRIWIRSVWRRGDG
jgi:SAM-dependent methyltransferase